MCSATEMALPPGVFIDKHAGGGGSVEIHVIDAHARAADDAEFGSFL